MVWGYNEEEVLDTLEAQGEPKSEIDKIKKELVDNRDFDDPDDFDNDAFKEEYLEELNKVAPTKEDEEKKEEPEKEIEQSKEQNNDTGLFDNDTVKRITELGFSQEELSGFKTKERLDAFLSKFDTQEMKIPPKADEQKQEPPETESDGGEDEIELDEDEYDPTIVKLFKSMQSSIKTLHSELKSAKESLQSVQEHRKQQEMSAFFDRFDSLVDEHVASGEEWVELLGKGSGDTLEQTSQQYKNRIALIQQINDLAGVDEKNGRKSDLKDLFGKSIKLVFGDKLQEIEQKKIASKVEKRKTQFTQKPNTLNKKLDATQSAVKAVAAKMRQYGIPFTESVELEE